MHRAPPARSLIGQQVRAPKTAELIATCLRRQIVRGQLSVGDALPPEPALMEQFGVSRPTLREAFRILEAESLISIRRGSRGGAQVVSPDIAVASRYVGLLLQVSGTTVADVYEARMVLEPAAAALLALRRTKRDINDLNACIDELSETVDGDQPVGEPGAWSRPASRFHDLMLQRAGNRTLAVQAALLREVVATHVSAAVARTVDQPARRRELRSSVRAYRALVSFVEAKNAHGAESCWRTHMEAAARRLLRGDLGSTTVVDLFS